MSPKTYSKHYGVEGQLIKKQRLTIGLSQKDLAAAIAISPTYLNLIEKNKRIPPPALVEKLIAALTCRVEDIRQPMFSGLEKSIAHTLEVTSQGLDYYKEDLTRFVIEEPVWAKLLNLSLQSVAEVERTDIDKDAIIDHAHNLITRITAIRSSASILNTQGNLPENIRARFLNNIHTEARALSQTGAQILEQLDAKKTKNPPTAPLRYADIEHFANMDSRACEVHIAEHYSAQNIHIIKELIRDARALPLDILQDAMRDFSWDDLDKTASKLRLSPHLVLRRIALCADEIDTMPNIARLIGHYAGPVIFKQDEPHIANIDKISCTHWPHLNLKTFNKIHDKILYLENGMRFFAIGGTDVLANGLAISTLIAMPTDGLPNAQDRHDVKAGLTCKRCAQIDCFLRRAAPNYPKFSRS